MENRINRMTRHILILAVLSFIMTFTCVFGIFYSTSVEVAESANAQLTDKTNETNWTTKLNFKTTPCFAASFDGEGKTLVAAQSNDGATFSKTISENDVQANKNLQVEESAEIEVAKSEIVTYQGEATIEEAIFDTSNNAQFEKSVIEQSQTTEQPVAQDDLIAKFNRDSDLAVNRKISIEKMNTIIDKSAKMCGGTPFKDQGAIFIEASELSGLDPVYIFAHASWESGYGKSYQAKNKHNYFGIASFDSSPGSAYVMGTDMRAGICNGAIWIANNYYNQGQTTLNLMIYGKKRYAASGDKWINGILGIMNRYTEI